MINKTQVLVVDDEPQIRKLLRTGLSGFGYEVVLVPNAQDALESVARQRPDIVILDINLGANTGGLDVCRQLRERSTTPVIVLTVNDDKRTKLAALNAGADDYITKPFDMEELEARIRAVLRRSAIEKTNTANAEIHVHDLTIDLVKRRVTLKSEEIHLTPTEYKLLRAVATYPGRVLTFMRCWTQSNAIRRTQEPNTLCAFTSIRSAKSFSMILLIPHTRFTSLMNHAWATVLQTLSL